MSVSPPVISEQRAPVSVDVSADVLARQREAAADTRSALLALIDSLSRLTAGMCREHDTATAAAALRFSAAVSAGLSDEQCAQWLDIRAVAVPAIPAAVALYRALCGAADTLDGLRDTADTFATSAEAELLAALDVAPVDADTGLVGPAVAASDSADSSG